MKYIHFAFSLALAFPCSHSFAMEPEATENSTRHASINKALNAIFAEKDSDLLQNKDNKIIKFYCNEDPIEGTTDYIDDIFKFSWEQLEDRHNFIQLLFPLREKSGAVPSAPTIKREEETLFQSSPYLQKKMLHSLFLMLDFYGLQYDPGSKSIQRASHFEDRAKNWLSIDNHNHARLTRIIKSLTTCGLGKYSKCLLDFLNQTKKDEDYKESISENTIKLWNNALLPQWNSQLTNTSGGDLPDGWLIWHHPAYDAPNFGSAQAGHLTGTGEYFGFFYPIDLSLCVGKTLKFTAGIEGNNEGPYIEFWTSKDIMSRRHSGNGKETLSVTYDVIPGEPCRLYIGTVSLASFTVKDLRLSVSKH